MIARALSPLIMLSVPAAAAPVVVAVQGPGGAPLAGAVVTLEVAGRPAPAPRGSYTVEQRDIRFQPQILIVPVGATVRFPNRDKVRHHVFSFSKAKRFELKLYGREEARSVVFDKPGPVSLGCNIHDAMSGSIYVSASPWAAPTDGAGRVRWTDAPSGPATLRVWHPSIRAPGNTLSQAVTVGPNGYQTTLTIRR